jgi:hypothetical protein
MGVYGGEFPGDIPPLQTDNEYLFELGAMTSEPAIEATWHGKSEP